jgi:hypothetical protein
MALRSGHDSWGWFSGASGQAVQLVGDSPGLYPKLVDREHYDPKALAERKQAQRSRDAEALATGRMSAEELRQENGVFSSVDSKPRWDLANPLQ